MLSPVAWCIARRGVSSSLLAGSSASPAFTVLYILLAALAVAGVRSRAAAVAAVVLIAFRAIDSPGP